MVAPTALAAINVGGSTIHSFFQLPPRAISQKDIKSLNKERQQIFSRLELLIIDEVSMVRADVMDAICGSLNRFYREQDLPFGGRQILLLGDLFQLPPVVRGDEESEYIERRYGGPWFFCAPSLLKNGLFFLELESSFRHSDPEWTSLLDSIRSGSDIDGTVKRINEVCKITNKVSKSVPILTGTNNHADNINKKRMEETPGQIREYEAIVNGNFSNEKETQLPAPSCLQLKPGAQVVFTKNDGLHRWVNGSMGRVVELADDEILVEMLDGRKGTEVTVEREEWKKYAYRYDYDTEDIQHRVDGLYTQFPLRLGWAMTIHKAQGLTLQGVHISIGNKAFASGQTYVALSRCREPSRISLQRELRPDDILVDKQARDFYKSLR